MSVRPAQVINLSHPRAPSAGHQLASPRLPDGDPVEEGRACLSMCQSCLKIYENDLCEIAALLRKTCLSWPRLEAVKAPRESARRNEHPHPRRGAANAIAERHLDYAVPDSLESRDWAWVLVGLDWGPWDRMKPPLIRSRTRTKLGKRRVGSWPRGPCKLRSTLSSHEFGPQKIEVRGSNPWTLLILTSECPVKAQRSQGLGLHSRLHYTCITSMAWRRWSAHTCTSISSKHVTCGENPMFRLNVKVYKIDIARHWKLK